ncbi:MAG: STAS domain-containing protein [Bdellovibrionales bacterium]
MVAKLSWYGDIMIVGLQGQLDFESVNQFKKKSQRHFAQNKVIFSLKDLSFVGSTGVQDFVRVLAELSEKNPYGLGVAEARSEYELLLEPYQGHSLVMFKSLDLAKRFFSLGHLEFQDSENQNQEDELPGSGDLEIG